MALAKKYMQRCFDLAGLAIGHTAPNPIVGAVLVYQDRIIGEGYHTGYGKAHAEVEAVRAVTPKDRHLIAKATLFVSLEPCSVYGRTPPCTELIIKEKIPEVVIASLDQSPGVNGVGVARLRAHGVKVTVGVCAEPGRLLSAPRNTFVTRHRPYIILKYASSINGFLAQSNRKPLWLTNSYSKRLVHRWRAQTDAIMIGTGTAFYDDPQLTTRLFPGPSPIRIIPDRHLRLPRHLQVFDDTVTTLIFTQEKRPSHHFERTEFIRIETEDFIEELLKKLYHRNVQTLMVEGGQAILDYFVKTGTWDEARVFVTPHYLADGLRVPSLGQIPQRVYRLQEDQLKIYYRPQVLRSSSSDASIR